MPKKRKSEASGQEEVDKTLFSSFCAAANSISQLYSLAQGQQRVAFHAGERHSLVRFQQWLLSEHGAGGGAVVSKDRLLDFIQDELERLDEGYPAQAQWQQLQQQQQCQQHPQAVARAMESVGLPNGGVGAPELSQAVGLQAGLEAGVNYPNAQFSPTHMRLLSQLDHCHIRPRLNPPAAPSPFPHAPTRPAATVAASHTASGPGMVPAWPAQGSQAMPSPTAPASLDGNQATEAAQGGIGGLRPEPSCGASRGRAEEAAAFRHVGDRASDGGSRDSSVGQAGAASAPADQIYRHTDPGHGDCWDVERLAYPTEEGAERRGMLGHRAGQLGHGQVAAPQSVGHTLTPGFLVHARSEGGQNYSSRDASMGP